MQPSKEKMNRVVTAFQGLMDALQETGETTPTAPAEPPKDCVIIFTKRFRERAVYRYAAIHTPVGWFVTGRRDHADMSPIGSLKWAELVKFIDGNPTFLMKKSEQLDLSAVTPVSEDPQSRIRDLGISVLDVVSDLERLWS